MNLDNPLTSFTILLLVSLLVPPIFERLRLPGLIGLLVAGVALGPDGLGWLNPESDTMKLLSDVGKVYLMFVAGLEIDLAEFRRKQRRSLGFGLLTFAVPLALGSLVAYLFGMSWVTAILVGSLMASHTLLAYPIVTQLGIARKETVTVTVGATIFTDIAALLVLAVCLSVHSGEFSLGALVGKLIALGLYAAIVLVGLDSLGKEYFRRTGNEESNQFLFVLLAVFLAAVGAQLLDTDKIVGAFLAGLAVNDVVGRSPVEEKVEFVGSTLFIPFFFVDIGLLLDISGFLNALTAELTLTVAIVGSVLLSKLVAAMAAKLAFRYNWDETLLMWSLSLPQVAATLAAALAALNAGAIEASIFNATIVMMVVTAVLGPLLTKRFGGKVAAATPSLDGLALPEEVKQSDLEASTAIVALKNPHSVESLSVLGAALAQSGTIVPVSVTVANAPIAKPVLRHGFNVSRQLLDRAMALSPTLNVEAIPVARLDDDAAMGITRTAHEHDADWIVMGWHETMSVSARLMGNTVDALLWSAPCPVAIAALQTDPREMKTVLVAMENLSAAAGRLVRVGATIAKYIDAHLEVMYVCPTQPSAEILTAFEALLADLALSSAIQTVATDRVAEVILERANQYDLTVIRSRRFRTAGGLSVHDTLGDLTRRSRGSIVAIGEPEDSHEFSYAALSTDTAH